MRGSLQEPRSRRHDRKRSDPSADAAVRFRQENGRVRVVLIEWKYTESYSPISLAVAASGTSRIRIYQPLLTKPDCPIDLTKLDGVEDLFYEPFYQLVRQQLLATAVWAGLVKEPGAFTGRSVEDLFGGLPVARFAALGAWWRYIQERHPWAV